MEVEKWEQEPNDAKNVLRGSGKGVIAKRDIFVTMWRQGVMLARVRIYEFSFFFGQ